MMKKTNKLSLIGDYYVCTRFSCLWNFLLTLNEKNDEENKQVVPDLGLLCLHMLFLSVKFGPDPFKELEKQSSTDRKN